MERSDWSLVPSIGTYVETNHPITCVNPMKAFCVEFVRCDGSGAWYVRGKNTCWFHVNSVKPAALENALAAEAAERVT